MTDKGAIFMGWLGQGSYEGIKNSKSDSHKNFSLQIWIAGVTNK